MVGVLKRWRWPLLLAVAVLAGLAYAFWPRPVAVDVSEVTRGPMRVTITDDGVTRVRDVFVLSAPTSGIITRVEIEAGDPVVAGETIIAVLNPRMSVPLDPRTRLQAESALRAARSTERMASAELRRSQSALALAESELGRAKQLAERGFVTAARLDAARTERDVASAAADMAQAELQRARAEAARAASLLAAADTPSSEPPILLAAPASGKILRVLRESESPVLEGEPIVEIGDSDDLEIVADMLSRDAVRISPGAPAEILNYGGEHPLSAHVERVEPFGRLKISALGIEEQRVNVILDLDRSEDALRLGHGYQIDAAVTLWQDEDVVRVPIGAIFRHQGEWHAFAVAGGRAELRRLNLGHMNDTHAEVLNGLAEGEQVVINPSTLIDDGSRVAPR